MSGNWNRTPRKGEKSSNAIRSDQEHRVRIEYRDAGRIEGLVMAWELAHDAGSHEVATLIAMHLLMQFPKAGRVALANAGASIAAVDDAENRAATRRRLLAQAKAAAKAAGADDDA